MTTRKSQQNKLVFALASLEANRKCLRLFILFFGWEAKLLLGKENGKREFCFIREYT